MWCGQIMQDLSCDVGLFISSCIEWWVHCYLKQWSDVFLKKYLKIIFIFTCMGILKTLHHHIPCYFTQLYWIVSSCKQKSLMNWNIIGEKYFFFICICRKAHHKVMAHIIYGYFSQRLYSTFPLVLSFTYTRPTCLHQLGKKKTTLFHWI